MFTIDAINRMDREDFVTLLGPVFENSPWVARGAWEDRPFADAEALHGALFDQVLRRDGTGVTDFLHAHPDLAGQEARAGKMTAESTTEQGMAGLDRLSAGEVALIDDLNRRYRARHGFPFIVCARHYTKAGIFAEFAHRLKRDTAIEREEALRQIASISRYRLKALLALPTAAQFGHPNGGPGVDRPALKPVACR